MSMIMAAKPAATETHFPMASFVPKANTAYAPAFGVRFAWRAEDVTRTLVMPGPAAGILDAFIRIAIKRSCSGDAAVITFTEMRSSLIVVARYLPSPFAGSAEADLKLCAAGLAEHFPNSARLTCQPWFRDEEVRIVFEGLESVARIG